VFDSKRDQNKVDYFGQSKRGDLVRIGLGVPPLCDDDEEIAIDGQPLILNSILTNCFDFFGRYIKVVVLFDDDILCIRFRTIRTIRTLQLFSIYFFLSISITTEADECLTPLVIDSDADIDRLCEEKGLPSALKTPYPFSDPTKGVFCSRTLNLRSIQVGDFERDNFTSVQFCSDTKFSYLFAVLFVLTENALRLFS